MISHDFGFSLRATASANERVQGMSLDLIASMWASCVPVSDFPVPERSYERISYSLENVRDLK